MKSLDRRPRVECKVLFISEKSCEPLEAWRGGLAPLSKSFSTRTAVIVLAWVSDETTKRAYGAKSDVYRVFQCMVDGHILPMTGILPRQNVSGGRSIDGAKYRPLQARLASSPITAPTIKPGTAPFTAFPPDATPRPEQITAPITPPMTVLINMLSSPPKMDASNNPTTTTKTVPTANLSMIIGQMLSELD